MSLIPEPTSPLDAKLARFLLRILTASGAALTLPATTPAGAAAIASAANQLVDRVTRDWGDRAARNAIRTAELAAEETGLPLDEFADRIASDPDTQHLAAKVFPGVADAQTDAQLRLLATILGNGVLHPELVVEESLIASAVVGLESPHFRMLAILHDPPPGHSEPTKRPLQFWSGALLQSRLGWQPAIITAVLLRLQAAGLVYLSDTSIDGGPATWGALENLGAPVDLSDMACEVTLFGQLVIERAVDAEEKSAGSRPIA